VNESVASMTALVTSLMRALHTRSDPRPLLNDPWGGRLVPKPAIDAIRGRFLAALDGEARERALAAPEAFLDERLRSSPAYATVITRSRFTEDALQAAIANGTRQYVLIGAGFDSYALRQVDASAGVDVYEIDHPATQSLKRQRLLDCGVDIPASLHFIPADLSNEDLGTALSRTSFRPREPAFFAWLGVTMYLTREANMASLNAIARRGAPGSELVFTYLDHKVFGAAGSRSETFAQLRSAVARAGEPFLSGFDPKAIEGDLRSAGLVLLENLDDRQLVERFDKTNANGLLPAATSRVAHARVARSAPEESATVRHPRRAGSRQIERTPV